MDGIDCMGFVFYNDFDSANLAKVTYVPPSESINTANKLDIPDAEFNIRTKPDCGGTEFENGNRTWFYFGVKSHSPSLLVRLNIVDLNRQGKMYSQGMAPVYRVIPGKAHWERIKDKPTYNTIDDVFTLSFKFKTPENVQAITYFAFTYPFSYSDLQKMLLNVDLKFQTYTAHSEDDIYYYREVLCRSLCGRDIYLLTITSYHGLTPEQEVRLKHLFPEQKSRRSFKFVGKKTVFVSARVHPGETPSSFVFNGLLNLLLTRDDPVAMMLRRLYVFKMVPFLNPDGVANGHYRTDTRGVNLNRVYLNPSLRDHPSVYAARALIRYYHYGCEKEEEKLGEVQSDTTISTKVSHMSLEEKCSVWCMNCNVCRRCKSADQNKIDVNENESGLFLYIDLHGHASKKGIFMYGNHFDDLDRNVECMLLPKLMSLNNHHFHFTSCNFTERNMYLKDRRDGMSREGSGRVAVLKLTGLTKSYTLECNYNTGRLVNTLPPTNKEPHKQDHTLLVPPKYTPQIYEEVGRSLACSILDLTGDNPVSRVPNSEYHTISNLKDWLRLNCAKDVVENPSKIKMRNLVSLHNQGKVLKKRLGPRPKTVPLERKDTGKKFKVRPKKSKKLESKDTEAGPSQPFLHSFGKNSKCKFKKHPLRRLKSAELEKGKKRKKLKAK